MKKLFGLFCLALALTVWAAEDKKFSPWDAWRQGYEVFQKGEVAFKKGELEEALKLYKQSRDLYLEVQKARPDWNQNVINNRLELCNSQIEKIEKNLGGGKAQVSVKPGDTQTSVTTSPSRPGTTASTTAENENYRKKYFNLFVEVENLRKQVRAKDEIAKNMETLLKEKQTLENDFALLNKRYVALRDKEAQPDKALEQANKLLLEEKMKSEVAEKNFAVSEAARKSAALQVTSLELRITQSEKALADLRKEKDALERSMSTTQSNLKKFEEVRKEYQDRIDQAGRDLKQALGQVEKQKEELKQLQSWLEEARKQDGGKSTVADELLDANTKLKKELATLQKSVTDHVDELAKLRKNSEELQKTNKGLLEHAAALDGEKAILANELKVSKEQYLRLVNGGKITVAELETLRKDNKEMTESLRRWIDKHDKLQEKLDAKTFSEQQLLAQMEKAAQEKAGTVELKKGTLDDLQLDLKSLEARNSQLNNENKTLRDAQEKLKKQTAGTEAELKKFASLKEDYSDLKSRYDAILAEMANVAKAESATVIVKVDSVDKAADEAASAAPASTSGAEKTAAVAASADAELQSFLVNAAREAVKSQDYASAGWYYSELLKMDGENAAYQNAFAFYQLLANEFESAEEMLAKHPERPEDCWLLGLCALRTERFTMAKTAFGKAAKAKFTDEAMRTLLRSEFEKTEKALDGVPDAAAALSEGRKHLQ